MNENKTGILTLYHLITHTIGRDYWAWPLVQRSPTLAEAVEYSVLWPLLFQPGTRFNYSFNSPDQMLAPETLGELLSQPVTRLEASRWNTTA